MNLSDDFIMSCAELQSLCEQIVDMLPDDPADALTCSSMIIDMWARKNNRSSRATWEEVYHIAMAVHDEMGDCK